MPLIIRYHSVNTVCQKSGSNMGQWTSELGTSTRSPPMSSHGCMLTGFSSQRSLCCTRAGRRGGLSLVNVKYRAMAELIKSFLDTAINLNFKRNIYHHWHEHWYVVKIITGKV
jgi:hypothetical protein